MTAGGLVGDGRLRVALVAPYYPPHPGTPEAFLDAHDTLPGLVGALSRRGAAVTAFQLFDRRARVALDGGTVELVPAASGVRALARGAFRALPRVGPAYYEAAPGLVRRALAERPDVVHAFGFGLDVNLPLLAAATRRRSVPLVVSYHGGLPRQDGATWLLRRFALGSARRLLVTTRDQARPWRAAGLARDDQVVEVLETSTLIRPVPPAAARAATGIGGDPACVMACRLRPVKDPVTVLTGFALVAERLPGARLTVVPLSSELESACRGLVAALPVLQGRVTFREPVPRSEMGAVLSAADYLLQASRREWSGLVVMEALACGTPPVVTDLPPLRRITGDGAAGAHFPVGDAPALAAALLGLESAGRPRSRSAARERFAAAVSFDALAADLMVVYRDVVAGTRPAEGGSDPRASPDADSPRARPREARRRGAA